MAARRAGTYCAAMVTSCAFVSSVIALTLFAAATQDPVAEFAGIQVVAQSYGEGRKALRPFPSSSEGVKIGLLIKSSTGGIVGFDLDKASRVEKFADDKGTVLHKAMLKRRFGALPEVSADGKAGIVVVEGTVPPSAGATKVLLEATVGVRIATRQETIQGGAVAQDAKLTCGPITIEVKACKEVGGRTELELTAAADLDHIAAVHWLDAEGKKLEADRPSKGRATVDDRVTCSETWRVKGVPASVEFVVWQDLRIVEVPVRLTIGIGAENGK
jgi:hypothetical protein